MEEPQSEYRKKTPHSTLEKVSKRILPDVAYRFLFKPTSDLYWVRALLRAAFGVIISIAFTFGLISNIPLGNLNIFIVQYVLIALCGIGGMLSLHFRCSLLLIFASILGSRGLGCIMLFTVQSLYQGPIVNIQHNVQEVVFSLGCNIDLQIGHSKIMWRTVSEPFFDVLQEIVADSGKLQREAQNVSRQFQGIRNEVMGQYGYDSFGQNITTTGNSTTQEQYTAKTIMRCEYVVKKGIDRCKEWFSDTWLKCMDTIKSPVINHFLCVPMKFDFLCNIMRVMTPWCKEQIPVEGNFGQTFDKLNSSISKLGEQFTTNVVYEKIENQTIFGETVLQNEFREELKRTIKERMETFEQIYRNVQTFFSFTFITMFISAYQYVRQYTTDICFDNVYITTYYRQIDERRKKRGKRYLLPLKKSERSRFIDPWSLKIHSNELQCLTANLIQVVSLALLVMVMLATDRLLYHIFDIISRHTFTEYSIASSHDIHIDIGGESMLANLLRKTIGAFNTSSNFDVQSSNWECRPKPRALSQSDYLVCTIPLLLMGIMCCLKVYTNRLRRVITTFYFPKREKKRILFLYNLQIQKRKTFIEQLIRQLRHQRQAPKPVLIMLLSPLKMLGLGVCWCWVCVEFMRQRKARHCAVKDCKAFYCEQCWGDLENCCVCSFPEDMEQDNDSDTDTVYYID